MMKIKLSVALAGLMAAGALAEPPSAGGVKVTKHVTVINGTNVTSHATGGDNMGAAMQAMQQALAQAKVPVLTADSITWSTETAAAAGPKAWLGVSADEIGDDVRSLLPEEVAGGLIVRHVEADGPAAKAGIQVNDILTKLEDQILVTPDQLRRLVQLRKDGDKIALTGLRKGKEMKFDASVIMKDGDGEGDDGIQVISFGGLQPNIKMELPAEVRKMLEAGKGGATLYSTSIVVRSGGGSFSSSGSSGGGSSFSSSGGDGISVKTENGKTTVTYKGKKVYEGTTTGPVSTTSVNDNGTEHVAVLEGDKVLWENTSGAAAHLKK